MMADCPFTHTKLAEIDEELGRDDIEILKFLCKDVLPKRGLQKMVRAIEIFEALEHKGKLGNGKGDFLLQCLYHMQKSKLIKKLGYRDEDIRRHINDNDSWEILPYRVLLYKISDDLGRDELETIKFSLKEEYHFSKNQLDRIKSGLDVMDLLESDGYISPADTAAIENIILQVLERKDLKQLFEEYKGINKPEEMQTEPSSNVLSAGQRNKPEKMQTQSSSNVLSAGQRRHEMLTSIPSQAPRFPGISHENLPVMTGGTHIAPVQIESVPPNQDNPDSNLPQAMPYEQPRGFNQLQHSSLQLERYKMDANPKGICLIINNEKFINQDQNRKGSEKDAEKLTHTFKRRGFIVRLQSNLKCNEMIELVMNLSKEDHSRYDALVVCILSHGEEGTVKGIDSKSLQIGDLTTHFKSSSCESLKGKPKLFFIQACQGNEKKKVAVPEGVQHDFLNTDAGPARNKTTPIIPGEPDFLLGFASVPGYASYRRKSRGTIYIDKLTYAIDHYADRLDLTTLLTHVNSEVSKEDLPVPQNQNQEWLQGENQPQIQERYLQVSAPLNGLTKLLFL